MHARVMLHRREIDGLRALAVVPVLLFHAGSRLFSGGYSGVDVFFVISGYLITSLIAADLERGTFSLARFYERRARRILPALFLVLGTCTLLARSWLLPGDWDTYARSLAAVLAFSSNFFFWSQSDYFAPAAELSPLLHTWSLAVEEQFYLLYPLLLVAVWRARRARLFAILVALVVLSLVAAEWGSRHWPAFNFFLLPSRAWELLAGAVAALHLRRVSSRPTHPRLQEAAAGAGLILILGGMLTFDAATRFPSSYSLLPVLGTVLVILFATPATLAGRVLGSRLFVGVGLISYSTYLWHQPLLALARYRFDLPAGDGLLLGLCGLSMALAWATWRWVEQPFRATSRIDLSRFATAGAAAAVALAAASVLGPSQARPSARESDDLADVRELLQVRDVYAYFGMKAALREGTCHSVSPPALDENGCLERRRRNVQLWGDSYAASLFYGLERVRTSRHAEFGLLQTTDGNGPPFFGTGRTDDGKTLEEANGARLEIARRFQPDVLVIAWMIDGLNGIGTKEKSLAELRATLARIHRVSPRSRVVVIGPFPHWSGTLLKQMVNFRRTEGRVAPLYMDQGLLSRDREWDRYFLANIKRTEATYISAQDLMCNEQGCLTRTGPAPTELTAVDWGHLTRAGSAYFAAQVEDAVFH